MTNEIFVKLNAIAGELETIRDNLDEDDFPDSFHFADCRDALDGALSKLDAVLFNGSLNRFAVGNNVVYNGVEYAVLDFRFSRVAGGYLYDLCELNGDGEMNDIPEDEIAEMQN